MTLKYVVNVDAVERHLKYFSIIDIIQEQFYRLHGNKQFDLIFSIMRKDR